MKVRRRDVPAEIPTSSMADVAFLLIIFFLVASFYSVTRGIQFSLPKHEPEALVVEPESSVLIEVAADGSLMVDRAPLAIDRLQPYLRDRIAQNPAKPVILNTSPDAVYASMTDVFDELRQAGIANVVIPTQSELSLYGLQPAGTP
jgi:biopolymer transport protein ExbD